MLGTPCFPEEQKRGGGCGFLPCAVVRLLVEEALSTKEPKVWVLTMFCRR